MKSLTLLSILVVAVCAEGLAKPSFAPLTDEIVDFVNNLQTTWKVNTISRNFVMFFN